MLHATQGSTIYFFINRLDTIRWAQCLWVTLYCTVPQKWPMSSEELRHNWDVEQTKRKKKHTKNTSCTLTIFPYQFTMEHVNIIRIYTSFTITNEMKSFAIHLSLPMHQPKHSLTILFYLLIPSGWFDRIYRNYCLFGFLSFRCLLCLLRRKRTLAMTAVMH